MGFTIYVEAGCCRGRNSLIFFPRDCHLRESCFISLKFAVEAIPGIRAWLRSSSHPALSVSQFWLPHWVPSFGVSATLWHSRHSSQGPVFLVLSHNGCCHSLCNCLVLGNLVPREVYQYAAHFIPRTVSAGEIQKFWNEVAFHEVHTEWPAGSLLLRRGVSSGLGCYWFCISLPSATSFLLYAFIVLIFSTSSFRRT